MPIIGATDFHTLSRLTLVTLTNDFDVGPDLSEKLENSWVLAEEQVSLDTVCLGSTVSYAVEGQQRQVTLVLPNEVLVDAGRLSVLTPVGVALLGLKPAQRGNKRKNEIAKCLDRMGSRDDFNGHRLSHGWRGRLLVLTFDGACLQLGADTLDNLAQMFEHTIA